MSNIETIVIVGAGQAGASAILELRGNKYEGKIILVGAETDFPYERPPLSKDVILKPSDTKIEILSEQKLAAGDTSVAVPLNAEWDIALLETFKNANFAAIEAMTEADIRREGGRGGQEVRSWIAAFAALSELGEYEMTTQVYEAISEWIAGFGIVSAELKG